MKKISSIVLSISIVILGSYVFFEPEILSADLGPGTGPYTDTIAATLTVTEEISMSTTTDIAMPAMSMSQNSSAGGGGSSGVWTIKTNSTDGWELQFHASTTPALKSAADSFADYHATSGVPALWSVQASTVEFGFSALGAKVLSIYASSTDTTCTTTNNYTPNNHLQYMGFNGETDILVAQDTAKTGSSGTTTTLCVAAGQNGVYADSGSYTANITATGATK